MDHRLLSAGAMRRLHTLLLLGALLGSTACLATPPAPEGDVGIGVSLLTAAERRARAGQIRDAAADNGITQGWLLAGIADAETNLCHCWSEATWACQGPDSPDCGGGPVIAGKYDGDCSLRQGGLGMFQFDAGTYDQTLEREGDRILSIAGNVAAAVDFVAGMVVRSVYVSGVDTREEAIAWMNGVEIGNDRWHPWIQTVTHYYNGCTPSGCSAYTTRYNRYRDITADIYEEMGADFWTPVRDYGAEYVEQSFPLAAQPFELTPGQESVGYIEMRNIGEATWEPDHTFLGTTEPRDGASPIAGPDWISPSRAATVDRSVPPGETGRFNFTVRAPAELGDYPQFFNLVHDGVWFSEQVGPPDDQLQVRVTVVAPVDDDGDGDPATTDCDDADPAIHTGAAEVCDDGVDQDCDGDDLSCGTDAAVETDGGVGGGGGPAVIGGGCATSPGRGSPGALLLFGVLALAYRRRARA